MESGSDGVLRGIQKDIRVEDVVKAHQRALRMGFTIHYHFMVGFPEETRDDVRQTMRLMELLTRNRHAAVLGPSTFCPYPGTTLYKRVLELGFKPPQSLEGWIDYDWEEDTKFEWFDDAYRNYLREVATVSKFATRNYSNPILQAVRAYFRLRMKGLIHGISLGGWDLAIAEKARGLMGVARNYETFTDDKRQDPS